MMGYRQVLAIASRLVLAGVFFYGGIPKLFDLKKFASTVDAYGILPEVLVLPVAVALPVLEIIAAIGLLTGKRWAIYLTSFLYFLFIFVLSYGLSQGLHIDCGCFAENSAEHRAFSGLQVAFWRDVVLLVPVIYLYWHQFMQKKNKKENEYEAV